MTWIAWSALVVYLLGVVVIGNVLLFMMRGEVEPDATAEEKAIAKQMEEGAGVVPGMTMLIAAVAIVLWFILPVGYGLRRLAKTSSRS